MNTRITQWCKLIVISLALYLFFTFASPLLFSISDSWQRFVAVQDEIGVSSGALYYTDVAVTQDAEAHVREAVRLGMQERALQSANNN
ncbi:MAG: hypothetical protein IJU76_14945 [Desulfovibrionaceae bacterium]|nr:hypothetical protein [Desulfovibrionaceae bacterium]